MPIERPSIFGELSLRHFPNASDASFSIQIPNTPLSHGDFLLGDDDDGSFLRDMAGASTATPGPPRAISALNNNYSVPQPLHMITPSHDVLFPEPRRVLRSSSRISPTKSVKSKSKSKLKHTPRDVDNDKPFLFTEKSKLAMTQSSSSEGAMSENFLMSGNLETPLVEAFSVQVSPNDGDNGGDEADAPKDATSAETLERQRGPETRQLNSKLDRPIARSRRIVIASESSKTRSNNTTSPAAPPSTTITSSLDVIESGPDSQQKSRVPLVVVDNEALARGEGSSAVHSPEVRTNSSGPLASDASEDIVSVPQTNPESSSSAGAAAKIPKATPLNHPGESFSGLEPAITTTASSSPTRSSTKRPASVIEQEQDQERVPKRGKVTALALATTNQGSGASTAQVPRPPPPPRGSGGSSSSSQNARRTNVRVRDVRGRKASKPTTTAASSTLQAHKSTTTTTRRRDRIKLGDSAPQLIKVNNNDSSSSTSRPLGDNKRVELRPLIPTTTKPVEFKFQMDERIEARKAEQQQKQNLKHEHHRHDVVSHEGFRKTYQVPDFKTMHAQQEAKLAQLKKTKEQGKENIVPAQAPTTIPSLLGMNTEYRAREREKFNEQVREKEIEQERERERERREREEEEARVVRALRRKAVPRAHEVPEWYKDAPKRKKDRV